MTDTARRPTPDQDQGAPDPNRWRALAVCLVVGFMTLLDVSIVNVALPSIESSLGAGSSQVQWIVAGYALAFGLVLVPAGRIGDLYSRRLMFVVGLGGFVLTSAAAGLVQSATALAVVRLAQGISAGLVNPQVLALIQQLFTGAERGRAFGAFGTTIGLSTAVGPLLGGGILAVFGEQEGWRGVFLVNVPSGSSSSRWRGSGCPAGTRTAHPASCTSTSGAAAARRRHRPGHAAVRPDHRAGGLARPLVVPAARRRLLVAFVAWERWEGRHGREPVVDADLVKTRSYRNGALVGIAYFAGFTGIFLVVTLYLQSGLGLAPWQAGLVQTPFAVLSGIFAQVGGRQVATRGRTVVVIGLVVVAVGLLAADLVAASVQGTSGAIALSACLAVAGAGSGLVISPNQTLALADVPPRVAGVAGGVLQTGQRVGSAVGVAATTAIFFSTVAGSGLGGQARAAGRGRGRRRRCRTSSGRPCRTGCASRSASCCCPRPGGVRPAASPGHGPGPVATGTTARTTPRWPSTAPGSVVP